MNLTNPEKLILIMLAEIQEELDMKGGADHKLVAGSIYSENTWVLDWEMPGIVGSAAEPTPPQMSFVVDVLDMWSFMEEAHDTFDSILKKKVVDGAKPFGADAWFSGFDGNHEGDEMSIANFLIEDMGRFSRFKGRDLNSHCSSVGTYKRMLQVYEPLRATLDGRGHLSVDQVISVLQARYD